jgi:hypothetical protein
MDAHATYSGSRGAVSLDYPVIDQTPRSAGTVGRKPPETHRHLIRAEPRTVNFRLDIAVGLAKGTAYRQNKYCASTRMQCRLQLSNVRLYAQ